MKYHGLIGGFFWFGIGILLSIWSTRYEIGSISHPGPGLFPLILGIILILLSIIILISQIVKITRIEEYPSFGEGRKNILFILIILIFSTLLFEKIGYLITFFSLIFLAMSVVNPRGWRMNLIFAILTIIGIYLVFVLLLEQPLPKGYLILRY